MFKLMSIESVVPSNNLILCPPILPSIFPSIRVFSNEMTLHIRWPKYWSFSFSISPSNEYSGLISCRIDWFDLLAIQGDLKRLLQHQSLKTSVIPCSVFFMVQLSHPYITTRKFIALTIRTFVGNVMSLLFNMFPFLRLNNIPLCMCVCIHHFVYFSPFSSVTQSCRTLCDPMNRSMPGFPVHHQLPEFTQTHAHQVGNAIRPSHPVSSFWSYFSTDLH